MLRGSSRRPGVIVLLALAALLVAMLPATVAADSGSASGANGVRLTVEPRTVRDLKGEVMIEVTGSGFSTTENGGFGIYVSFGRKPAGDRVGNPAFLDATVAYDAGSGHGTKWVRPSTPSGANQARLGNDGTFSLTLAAKAVFTAPNGVKHSYDDETLGIYAYAAHGTEGQASSFSQYVFVPLRFKAAATPKPTAKATPKPTTKPTAKATAKATAKPTSKPTPHPTAKPTPVAKPTSSSPSEPDATPAEAPNSSAESGAVPTPTEVVTAAASPGAAASGAASAGPSASPSEIEPDDVVSASSGTGTLTAIPLLFGLLILGLATGRWILGRRSGQAP